MLLCLSLKVNLCNLLDISIFGGFESSLQVLSGQTQYWCLVLSFQCTILRLFMSCTLPAFAAILDAAGFSV